MNTVYFPKKELDLKQYIKRSALESDFETLITEPVKIIDEKGKVKIVYDHLEGIDTSAVVKALQRIEYHVGYRTRGLKSTSRIFGYRPRLAMRADYCSSTSMANDYPEEHAAVCDLGKKLSQLYFSQAPEVFDRHQAVVREKVKNEWYIPDSVFTSGIINKNNPLKYHFDTGNFNDVFSVMVVFKAGIQGGYLSCPEYNIGFQLPHDSVFMFDGQGILHGVTPIKRESPLSFRYSIVYYSLKGIWKCLTINEEIARVRNTKTKRERIRYRMPEEHKRYLLSRFGKQ